MTVVVAGPESSGTRHLHRIVTEYIGVPALHRSMPNDEVWWDHADYTGARFVVIVRRPDCTVASQVARDMPYAGAASWDRAIAALAAIPDALWVCYEALVAAPQVQADRVAAWLGVVPTGTLPETYDANAKWLAQEVMS